MERQMLDDLNRHAAAIGRDLRLVQGAGGNLSGKDGDLVWVKASGTRLAEAQERPVFVGVDGPRARVDVLHHEDLRHVVVEVADERASRPSIETALHVLLPHRFVFHVHSVGAVAAGARQDPHAVLDRLRAVAPVGWVPYAKPGIALARSVLAAQERIGATDEAVFLLGNHGLLTAADSADRAGALVEEAESVLRRNDRPLPDDDGSALAPAGTLDAAATRLLTGGVLTPDSAVFLGSRPFGAEPGQGSSLVVTAEGGVVVDGPLSADAREIGRGLVGVAQHADPSAPVRYLDEDEVAELVDWEAETWRRAMQR